MENGEIQIEHKAILQEVALWNFANGEALYNVKPLSTIKEDNVWYTQSNDDKVIYAFYVRKDYEDWKYGERKNILLANIEGNSNTKVSVLGYKSELVEYKIDFDAKLYHVSTPIGLLISAVNGQRFYTNNQWPNAVVLKIENASFRKNTKTKINQINIDGAK